MHSSLFWYQGHLKLNILFTHPFVSEMCGNSTHRKQEPKQHKTTWGKENKMFNLVICSPPSFYHNTGSPKMLFPSLYHKFLSNDMWLPPCPRTATLLKAWKLHSLLCFKLSWQNPAGFRLDTHGCWRRSQISRGHSIVHKIQLFFFFFPCLQELFCSCPFLKEPGPWITGTEAAGSWGEMKVLHGGRTNSSKSLCSPRYTVWG